MGEWQPIETAPKDGTRILMYDRYNREAGFAVFVGAWSKDFSGSWYAIPGGYSKKPTHWLPLPQVPDDR